LAAFAKGEVQGKSSGNPFVARQKAEFRVFEDERGKMSQEAF